MSSYLPDGSVVPHYFGLEETSAFDNDSFANFPLRMGEVVDILYPNDKRNLNRQFIEYTVRVQHRVGGAAVTRDYTNCILANPLAGLADRFHFTLRKSESKDQDKDTGIGLGSKVLLLCVNGEQVNAVIIGGMRDEKDTHDKNAVKDLGHHLYFVFNGLSFFIDKDGQLVVTYNGKTTADGKRDSSVSSDDVGSTLKFSKDGSIQIADKDGKNAIFIDHANGKVTISRDNALEIGDATDYMLLGKSFRDNQKQMHNEMKQSFKLLKNLLQQAGAQLNTAGGAVAGPFMAAAAGPSMIAAAQLLIQAAGVADQLGESIDDFELDGEELNGYLSRKNKAD